ncbi:MAG: TlpA family protein disulfide reductase [Actinomycetota bacterium]|nr:TlpA family protein disulfide reductase [Actinomycetota bacterium]
MHRRSLVVVPIVLASLAAGCARDATPTGAATASAHKFQQLGSRQLLPQSLLPRLDGEGVLDTSSLHGTPAVLNFWATWCAFCVEEMPALEAVHREVRNHVRFVGIDREDDLDKARTLAEKTGVSYELVADEDGSFFRALQGRGMPTTVLVSADGSIVYRHAGPLTANELRRLIAEHLDVPAGRDEEKKPPV